jgi:hypothetical protein
MSIAVIAITTKTSTRVDARRVPQKCIISPPRKRMTDGRPVHGRWVMMGSVLNGVKQAGQIARCDSKMWIRLSLHHIKKTFQNNPGHVFLQIYFVYRFGRSVPLIKERVARLCCVNFPM